MKVNRRSCTLSTIPFLFWEKVLWLKHVPWYFLQSASWNCPCTSHRPDPSPGLWSLQLNWIHQPFAGDGEEISQVCFVWCLVLLCQRNQFCKEPCKSQQSEERSCLLTLALKLKSEVHLVGRHCKLWHMRYYRELMMDQDWISQQCQLLFVVGMCLLCRCTWLFLPHLLVLEASGKSHKEYDRSMSSRFWTLRISQLSTQTRIRLLIVCPVHSFLRWCWWYSAFTQSSQSLIGIPLELPSCMRSEPCLVYHQWYPWSWSGSSWL